MRKALLASVCFAVLSFAPTKGEAQTPCQWNYSFDVNGVATATYCGNIVVNGTGAGSSTPSYQNYVLNRSRATLGGTSVAWAPALTAMHSTGKNVIVNMLGD